MKIHRRFLFSALLALAAQPAYAISITFDYSYDTGGFFDATQRSTLDQAGAYLGSRLQDSLTAINSGGSNDFTATFFNPSATASAVSLPSFDVAANAIRVYVGASDLGAATLGSGGPGGYSVSGDADFLTNAQSRGQTGALVTPPTDFGPWGGAIGFNAASNWYFDTDANTVERFSGYDFFSVAVHELGHVLGFGTSASWDAKVSGQTFTGDFSKAAYGGAVPLDSDLAHWAAGTMGSYNGSPQETAMESGIAAGQRKYFTGLDFAALQDVGWQASATPVPLPGALVLLFSGISFLAVWGKRRAVV